MTWNMDHSIPGKPHWYQWAQIGDRQYHITKQAIFAGQVEYVAWHVTLDRIDDQECIGRSGYVSEEHRDELRGAVRRMKQLCERDARAA